tara:strand:+ start:425 stop:553 length:129 start_codon:yes stop_codon:yes gene_type:complete
MNLLQETIQFIKEDPTEFFGSILVLTAMFGLLYVALWIGCPC